VFGFEELTERVLTMVVGRLEKKNGAIA